MRVTAIWGKGEFGWVYIASDRTPVIQAQQDHAGDLSEVTRKINQELLTYRDGQTEITVGIDPPATDPVPTMDWTVGDEVYVDGAWREVVAITSALDNDTGRWVDVPQFGTVLDTPDQRIVQNFRAVGGVNGGTSHLARPAQVAPAPNLRP